ncbi:hypothetical protein MCAV_01280 [[Mycoplasma] cavipharyngis]|uniref:hypothetical protein n=1 Tax=[Mycoplasma] cavipharyngis TaxID=92757 RepID=UPI0037043C38
MKSWYSYQYLNRFLFCNIYLIALMIAIILDLTTISQFKNFTYSFLLATVFSVLATFLNQLIHQKIFFKFSSSLVNQTVSTLEKSLIKFYLILTYCLIVICTSFGLLVALVVNQLIKQTIFDIYFVLLGIVPGQLGQIISLIFVFAKKFIIKYKL